MSIYRSGHCATSFVTHNDIIGLQYYGGNGKIAPETQSATTKRLFAPLSAQITDHTDQNGQSFEYNYQHPIILTPENKEKIIKNNIDIVPYLPLSREHSISHTITTPQLPSVLYAYIMTSLLNEFQQYLEQNNQDDNSTTWTNTLFSVLYGGRQSPTVIISDLWLHYRLNDLWIQVLPPNNYITLSQPIKTDTNTPQINLNAIQQSQSFVFSIPVKNKQNNDNNDNNDEVEKLYKHYLINNNIIYSIKFTSHSSAMQIIDEIPSITIISELSIDDIWDILPNLYEIIVKNEHLKTKLPENQSQLTTIIPSIIESLSLPSYITNSLTQIIDTDNTTQLSSHTTISTNDIDNDNNDTSLQLLTTTPLPRYKTASASIGSEIFIHAGRSGFALNYPKKIQQEFNSELFAKKNDSVNDDSKNDIFTTLANDDSIMLESILPLTPAKPVNQQQTQLQQLEQSNNDSNSNIDHIIEPTFVSLILNDLWKINFASFPYKWSRLDTIYSQHNQIIPSHRFGHAATIITSNNDENNSKFLVIHGGLRLNHDRHNTNNDINSTQKSTNYNNNNNDNTSSYHKALISSPTLFFINITPFINTTTTNVTHNSISIKHYTPPLVLDRPHHTDKSDQLILPPSIQIGQRPFDLYGHYILPVYFNPSKILLLAIGGTSHTCLAGASIMALDVDMNLILNNNKDNNDDSLSSATQNALFWSPIHQPIEDALFIRHTANITTQNWYTRGANANNNNNNNTNNDQNTINIAVLGGGALCFSFGTYYSPSLCLSIKYHDNDTTKQYSSLTPLSVHVNPITLTSLTPSTIEEQNEFQQQQQINASNTTGQKINTTKQLNKQKQQQQQKQKQLTRDNHTVIDISKNIKGVSQTCVVCGIEFDSKNKLFKHISITGHKKVE